MFFATPDSISAGAAHPSGALFASSLTFAGSPRGSFGAVLSQPLAIALATDFLGLEDASALEIGQAEAIVGELSNIICGAVLSELEASFNFDISSPRVAAVSECDSGRDFLSVFPVIC